MQTTKYEGLPCSLYLKGFGSNRKLVPHVPRYSLFLNIFLLLMHTKKWQTCLVRSEIEIQAERKRKKQRNLKENIERENLTTSHRNFNFNPPTFFFWGGEPSIIISLGLNKRGKLKSLFPFTVFTHLAAKPHFIFKMHFYKLINSNVLVIYSHL